MSDLFIAKKMLVEENLTIVFVKEGKAIYKSKKRGVEPLFLAYQMQELDVRGCSAADKVVGKAAAWIYSKIGINNLYCNVIAKNGLEILKNKDVKVEFNTIVDYVQNRKKDDMCPIEKIAKDEKDFETLLQNIDLFYNKV